ncbi:MAG: GAF domain-containing protein [Ktedonobacteraceae bacterium]|nr:GAF domain-containing protein [Ktedonobacteraceae bacterium]
MQDQRSEHVSKASSLKQETLTTILQALADPTLARLEADDLSRAVLHCLRESMAADNLAILLLTEDHTALRIQAVLGLEEIVARDVFIPFGRGFVGQIAMQGIPLIVYDTSALEILTPLLREQLRSLLGVPLIVDQQVIGVLHVGMKREYLFTHEDIALLQQVAASLAQAFGRTFLIAAAEQPEIEELVEAQLSAVIELVEAQQRITIELAEAKQETAIELMRAQQQIAIELMRAQQETAIELIRAQKQTTEERVKEQQQQTAGELVKEQQHVAIELMGVQQRVAIELMGVQRQERMKALERIKELEAIFNAITDAVIVYNDQEHIFRSNQAARYLLEAQTLSTKQTNNPRLSWRTAHPLRDEQGHPLSPEHLPSKRLLNGERIGASKRWLCTCIHSMAMTSSSLSLELLYILNKDICMGRCVCFMI